MFPYIKYKHNAKNGVEKSTPFSRIQIDNKIFYMG